MTEPTTTIVDVEFDGTVLDVRLAGGTVAAVGPSLPRLGTAVVEAGGGALLPGLHDHHLHLLALAAARRSVDLAEVAEPAGFDRALAAAHRDRPDGWLRVVGADERHGPLTADRLERLAPGRRVRVQHRTGAAWLLSAAAAQRVGVEAGTWLHRSDDELRSVWADDDPPDLAAVSAELARYGVTGVTDATPFADPHGFATLATARRRGDLLQRTVVTGGSDLAGATQPSDLERGPVKLIVGDHDLPSPDDLGAAIASAHRAGRPVAVHCVTRVATVLALVAWESAGARPGDRIEHGSVLPVELLPEIAELGLTVVTQPAFVRARGDAYRRDVEPDDRPHLYRCGSLLDAGIAVGLSTDAPYGPADPWVAVATAADRRTSTGQVLGEDERIPARRALDGFFSAPDHPGGPLRRIAPGAPADLVLLDRPLAIALDAPSSDHVVATWIAGHPVHGYF